MFRFPGRFEFGRHQIIARSAGEHNNLNIPGHFADEASHPDHALSIALGQLIIQHHNTLQLFGQRQPEDEGQLVSGADGQRVDRTALPGNQNFVGFKVWTQG